jgi:hypothetical protein
VAGTPATLGATLDGVPVTTAAPTIMVTPGPASPAHSLVTVAADTVLVGGTVSVTLQALDAFDNPLAAGGLTVVFTTFGGTSTGTFAPVPAADLGNGSYTATFTATGAGTPTTVQATINGAAVTTALPTIEVR